MTVREQALTHGCVLYNFKNISSKIELIVSNSLNIVPIQGVQDQRVKLYNFINISPKIERAVYKEGMTKS